MQSSANEMLSIAVPSATKFAITLNDFGQYGATYVEIVEFRFFASGVEVGSPMYGGGCNADGGLASFSGDVGVAFDRIDITPFPAFNIVDFTFGITALLVSQINTCQATDPTCTTSLAAPANICPI